MDGGGVDRSRGEGGQGRAGVRKLKAQKGPQGIS